MSKEAFEKQNELDLSLMAEDPFCDRKMTRQQKRKFDEIHHTERSYTEMDPTTAALEKEYIEKTNIKYIQKVIIGEYEIDTWYYSPYPLEYEKIQMIFVCEKCLKYMALQKSYIEHIKKCDLRTPPGRQVYAEGDICVFELYGSDNKLYCQNLCLFAKFFLDHKTLYFDVSPFVFYILFEKDAKGFHIVSYFSKEKESLDNYNVACILTFPPYQRKGYGKFMISLSYQLSKLEDKIGTPERPLSDLGQLSYRSYWSYYILDYLRDSHHTVLDLNDVICATGFARNDILETLQLLNFVKYWKGNYVACFSSKLIDEYFKAGNLRPPRRTVNPKLLFM